MPRGSGAFGARPVSEGYTALVGEGESGPPESPLEFLLSVWRQNRAARLFVLCLSLVFVSVIITLFVLEIMGQTVTTPLSLTLSHWSDVRDRANNQSVEIRKKKWVTLCSSEWPTFNVGWPRDGTFNLDIISQVEAKVFSPGPHGHPDQVPYIVTWRALVSDPPLWVQPFVLLPKPCSSPITPTAPPPLKEQLSHPQTTPSRETAQPTPPPPTPTSSSLYPALTPLQDKSPKLPKPVQPAPKPVQPAPKTVQSAPVLPPDTESPLIDLLTEEPPPYPEATTEERKPSSLASPIAGRLRDRRAQPPSQVSQAFPLREGPNGRPQYWPFTASDLYNWKQHNPPFSKDPATLTNLIESILVTHQPTWDDCQQLLQTLLTSEEKQRVLLEARKNVPGDDGRPTQLPNEIDIAFPLTRPNWDFATSAGREHLHLYRQLLIAGLRAAARRPTNLAQVKQVIQGKEETPSAFLERLKEAYRMYTPYDPDDEGQATSVSMSFIWQSSPDIRGKLQRLEGLQGYTLSDLLKEAEKVFNKRETPEEKEERIWLRMKEAQDERDKKRSKELTKVLATVVTQGQNREGVRMGERERRRTKLDRDQCAYCKERGHWARECPRNPKNLRGPLTPKPLTSLLTLED
ncbi:bromodomain-containing protein 4-like [Neovison vison]|uniref:bromodomain-containing protein 4-like n=1 Tax=Neovison vison TaxID=452646 RepID=UPI001CF07725|nr:bromodomain-containing protein 4-like [Neogale vison]